MAPRANRRRRHRPGTGRSAAHLRPISYAHCAISGESDRQRAAKGGRVAYLGPNDISAFEALFATGLAGAVFVPLNTRLAAREIAYMLDDSASSVLIVAPSHHQTINEIETFPTSLTTILSVNDSGFEPANTLSVAHLHYESFMATGRPAGISLRRVRRSVPDPLHLGDHRCSQREPC